MLRLELGGELPAAAAWNTLHLYSLSSLHFESLVMIAVNMQQLRRGIEYLSPGNRSEEGEYSYQCARQPLYIVHSPSSLHILHLESFKHRIQHARSRIAADTQ